MKKMNALLDKKGDAKNIGKRVPKEGKFG